ncbi:hypothetical protein GALMADRAFT_679235 [Galerina marginata CBS 339.88]|uniref:Uncharacterized protein n=1 Tax=Galerina marginata (strain CBS 339.88) TaxID=685588 RepID=A0A067TKR8_GALM3|nr:hypothetical protein GALMADRAFT_679235 [Galerina marginata CBS 339.88]
MGGLRPELRIRLVVCVCLHYVGVVLTRWILYVVGPGARERALPSNVPLLPTLHASGVNSGKNTAFKCMLPCDQIPFFVLKNHLQASWNYVMIYLGLEIAFLAVFSLQDSRLWPN